MGMQAESDAPIDNEEAMIAAWTQFANASAEFKLNDSQDDVRLLAKGVLENMASKGLKYCPCRITIGDLAQDLKLVCPCGFKAQQVYREDGTCWCGLFVKR
jgi:ferredoxin-thioredoxin reductase catalytic subunit